MLPAAAPSQFVLRGHGRFLVKSEVWITTPQIWGCPVTWACSLTQSQRFGPSTIGCCNGHLDSSAQKKLEHPKLNYPFECAASKSAAIIDGGILTFIDFGKKTYNP